MSDVMTDYQQVKSLWALVRQCKGWYPKGFILPSEDAPMETQIRELTCHVEMYCGSLERHLAEIRERLAHAANDVP